VRQNNPKGESVEFSTINQKGLSPNITELFSDSLFVIASNRGPVTIRKDDDGNWNYQKGSGGLVTALLGLNQNLSTTWVASALSQEEQEWSEGQVDLGGALGSLHVKLLDIPEPVYEGYYNVISNPLLWFLQHSMWDFVRAPNINRDVWQAWENGYRQVNKTFAQALANIINSSDQPVLIMLQDYHLYLIPSYLRRLVKKGKNFTILHFVHIPFPGPEDWAVLPGVMRQQILEGMCAVDLLGFQTRSDALSFIRTCETHLPESRVNFRIGRVKYHRHETHVRDFPISIDVSALRAMCEDEAVEYHRNRFRIMRRERKLIVRVDRTEPSKNIVRGFEAFGEMLENHPEFMEEVLFLAIMVPSRLEVSEYQTYLDEIMAAAGRVNARFGNSDWEPIRVLVGEDYYRAVAALMDYDVLLVNPIADGMNLVAKEGPVVNQQNGVLILSERAGAHQQLSNGALVVSPCDIQATSEALYQGLTMPEQEKQRMSQNLVQSIEIEDINFWLASQLQEVEQLKLIKR